MGKHLHLLPEKKSPDCDPYNAFSSTGVTKGPFVYWTKTQKSKRKALWWPSGGIHESCDWQVSTCWLVNTVFRKKNCLWNQIYNCNENRIFEEHKSIGGLSKCSHLVFNFPMQFLYYFDKFIIYIQSALTQSSVEDSVKILLLLASIDKLIKCRCILFRLKD